MLIQKYRQARKNLGLEEGLFNNVNEEVVIGHEYYEDESDKDYLDHYDDEATRYYDSLCENEDLEDSNINLFAASIDTEDDSGNTESKMQDFLEEYAGNDILNILRKDLMSLASDIKWIKETNSQNEPFALAFKDAIKELLW